MSWRWDRTFRRWRYSGERPLTVEAARAWRERAELERRRPVQLQLFEGTEERTAAVGAGGER